MATISSNPLIIKPNESPMSLLFDLDEVLSPTVHYHSSVDFQENGPRSSPNWGPVVLAFPAVEPGGTTNRCTVCMEGFQVSGECGRRIPCGHVYHADCITTWLSLDDSCPLCRLKVSPEL